LGGSVTTKITPTFPKGKRREIVLQGDIMDLFFLFSGKIFFPVVTQRLAFLFLYLGPDTIMPLASILAAVAGFLLLFWRYIVNFIKKIFRRGGSISTSQEENSLEDPDLANHEIQDGDQLQDGIQPQTNNKENQI
jgi:hypothetical protein